MSEPPNDYMEPPPDSKAVIEKAIQDWTEHEAGTLTLPIEERALGSLDRLITRRLVRAGLMDAEPKPPEDL